MNVRTLTLGAMLSLSVALPAVAQETTETGNADADAGTVVATVGDTEITLGHMIALRERLPQQYAQLPDAALFEGVLTQLINQEALSRQAEDDGARTDLVLENERRAMRANAVLAAAADAAVTDEAVQAAYDEQFGDAGPSTEWNASHILLETEEAAAEVATALEGDADFAELARERSTGPSGPNGGALGWFGPGMMVPAFEEAIGGLEPGEVSAPFETQFGWHVARLNEVREQEVPSLEDVRGEIVEALQQQAVEAEVEAATAGIEVERPDLSDLDPDVLSNSDLID